MKYIGNKTKLYSFLCEHMALEDRAGCLALDMFSGTGAVSFLFKKCGINSVSNDFLSFCSHYTRAALLDTPPIPLEELKTEKKEGFITTNYSDLVGVNIFKEGVAKHIDGARSFLLSQENLCNRQEDYSYYLSQILESADFRSNIMGSYESFYKRGWRKQCDVPWEILEFDLHNSSGTTTHQVHNLDSMEFIRDTDKFFDFIYIDPPYNTRQYPSVFHVLETIALYDKPKTSGKVNKRVNYRKSNFSSKRLVHGEIEEMIQRCSDKTSEVFMSYSNEGLVDVEDLITLFKSTFRKVNLHEMEYRRFKTNSRNNNAPSKVKEVLFHAIK